MRHAEVVYADAGGRPVHPDHVSLTQRGAEQARAAAAALADVPLDRAVTSGLPRTEQTADAVLAGRNVPRAADPRWREIRTGGLDFANLSPDAVRAAVLGSLPAALTADRPFLSGETFGALQARVEQAWAGLLADADWQCVLVVSHGILNRALLAWLLGAPLGAVGKIEQDACCVNLIEVADDGAALVRLVNFTPDNPLKVGTSLSTLEGLARMLAPEGGPS